MKMEKLFWVILFKVNWRAFFNRKKTWFKISASIL